MSVELFNDITNYKQEIIRERFFYRKDSIGIEISKLFPGCVIYVQEPYEAKIFCRIQAYCSHLSCRNYRLIAEYKTPNVFCVSFDKPEPVHVQKVARQVRRYERDQEEETLLTVMPNTYRVQQLKTRVDLE